MPTLSQTDFTASHSFRLGMRSVVVGMDIINLFDQKTAINKNMTQLQSGTVEFDEADFYAGRVDFAAKAAVAGVQNPLFLRVNDYQLPRIIRFSARFSF
jgi:hypothetical protein